MMGAVVKVYVVCEYPHGQEDDVHSIKLVTLNKDEAERAARPDHTFYVDVWNLPSPHPLADSHAQVDR